MRNVLYSVQIKFETNTSSKHKVHIQNIGDLPYVLNIVIVAAASPAERAFIILMVAISRRTVYSYTVPHTRGANAIAPPG